jgi:hypothetical protein
MKNYKHDLSKYHQSKVFALLYPVFASDFWGCEYETLVERIGKRFILSPEQWEAILFEYELLHYNT